MKAEADRADQAGAADTGRNSVAATTRAEVDMATTNGSVMSDFPMTLSGRINPRRLHATIGDGSRRLRLHSTNGNVELRKN